MADRVVILPYDSEWPALFSSLGAVLRRALGETALRIDHIGSTSIPGLDAKPIIDVQISVASFEPLNAFRTPIESLGSVRKFLAAVSIVGPATIYPAERLTCSQQIER